MHVPLTGTDLDDSANGATPAVLTKTVWALFALSVAFAVWYAVAGRVLRIGTLLAVDGLTATMWVAVTFFSGIVHSYSRRYMAADPDAPRFFRRVFSMTVVVALMTAADHVGLFVLSWGTMGILMASLIGHTRGWPQARTAGRFALWNFLAGTGLVALAVLALWRQTGAVTISGIVSAPGSLSPLLVGASLALIVAAMVQSALFPFHKWLLSSMTAPTPASAMMHAGFVNAGGVLLTRFAPVFGRSAELMLVIVVVGAASALLAQMWMLAQTDIKSRLGCSTVAQMGFMILQCGLGFFAAAITHLIVHGFYKAYQFLSSGARIEQHGVYDRHAGEERDLPVPVRGGVLLVTTVGAGALFAFLTGKRLTTLNTGLFLTAVVALSGLHAARSLLDKGSVDPLARALGVPALMLPAIAVYSLVYNAVSWLTHGLPMIHVTLELTGFHWAILGLFVAGHVALSAGWHRRSPVLYTVALNAAQPVSSTLLTNTEEYNES